MNGISNMTHSIGIDVAIYRRYVPLQQNRPATLGGSFQVTRIDIQIVCKVRMKDKSRHCSIATT